ncbi:MAG: type II toxin-antitoxin system HicA family toxin [Candidatus Sumerlaeaceae bacterium]
MTRARRGVTAREFTRALEQDGFVHVRTSGSHQSFRHPESHRLVVVAAHRSSDTFAIGTLKRMIRDAGWTDENLQRLGLL